MQEAACENHSEREGRTLTHKLGAVVTCVGVTATDVEWVVL